LINEHKQITIN